MCVFRSNLIFYHYRSNFHSKLIFGSFSLLFFFDTQWLIKYFSILSCELFISLDRWNFNWKMVLKLFNSPTSLFFFFWILNNNAFDLLILLLRLTECFSWEEKRIFLWIDRRCSNGQIIVSRDFQLIGTTN